MSVHSSKHSDAEAEEMVHDYAKQRELLSKLQEEKQRMEQELMQNEGIMQEKIVGLHEERRNVQMLII